MIFTRTLYHITRFIVCSLSFPHFIIAYPRTIISINGNSFNRFKTKTLISNGLVPHTRNISICRGALAEPHLQFNRKAGRVYAAAERDERVDPAQFLVHP